MAPRDLPLPSHTLQLTFATCFLFCFLCLPVSTIFTRVLASQGALQPAFSSAEPAHRGSWIRHQVLGPSRCATASKQRGPWSGGGARHRAGLPGPPPQLLQLPFCFSTRQLGHQGAVGFKTSSPHKNTKEGCKSHSMESSLLGRPRHAPQSQVRGKRLGAVMEGIQRLSADRKLWKCLGGIFP